MKQFKVKQVLWAALILLLSVTPVLSHAEIVKSKTIDDGGSGPYKAIAAAEATLPTHTVYHPEDITAAFEKEGKLPVLVFANGGCSDTSITHEKVLSEIASHGYVVIAIGALQMTPAERRSRSTEATMLIDAIDWIATQNTNEESAYYERIDLSKIASGGQSCGGAQILAVASDPRIKTYMMFNSGMGQMSMAGASKESLKSLHGPIVYIVGGPSDVAYANALQDYDNIHQVPVALANLEEGGHMGTFGEEYGGTFARMALAWLDWQFKGLDDNAAIFLADDLEEFPGWTMKAKDFNSAPAENAITVTRDIKYREGDSQAWRLDMAMPAESGDDLRPALVIVHGGGWRGGEKEVDVYQKMMVDYARKGYVTINVEYRLTGEAPFPACIEDCKCAVRWLRAHAQEYRVDPNRIGAYGHSAGAHLALMLAMVPKSAGLEGDGGWYDYSSRVNVAAAGSPPTELGRDVPMAKKEWWPIGYISADHPPLFLIQGGDDPIVRPELTEDFVQKMKAVGANVKYLKIDGVGHDVAYASKLEITDPAIETFFAKYLKNTVSKAGQTTEMDGLLQSFVDQKKVSCVAGFVAQNGQVKYHKAFGWKDVENQVPATVDDYYVLFSQTKAITTVAFMTLVEKGLVAVEDPVAKYFPEIPDQVVTAVHEDGTYETRPVASPMTFAHLMSHSSGLNAGLVGQIRRAERQGSDRPAGFGGRIPTKTPHGQHSGGGNPEAKYLQEEMLALVKYPLGFDPGTQWSYHISSNMLGYLVERISGMALRDYVKQTILEPLGMDETDWYYKPEALDRFVKVYSAVDGELEPASNMYSEGTISTEQTYCEGAIGLNGPIGDYAKFCQMLLNKGEFNGHRILKPETIDLMTTVNRLPEVNAGGKGFQFGLGFELYNKHKKPTPEVSNTAYAWGGMFGTQYIIDPENDMIALFYINMQRHESRYPLFLSKAYQLFAPSSARAVVSSEQEAFDSAYVIIEEGGTGPYSAIVTEDWTLPGMTIFRPKDLTAFTTEHKLPILLWGNGACANTTQEHKNFLNEIASHGYLILAIGLLDQIEHRDETSRKLTESSQLLNALDWILAENQSTESIYFGKIEISSVAAMGMSCGGLQAIEISDDLRITTTVVCNSGVLPTPSPLRGMPPLSKDDLMNYHAPVLYIIGGPKDIAYNNAMDDFARVEHVPMVMTNHNVGHAGTYSQPHGGEFTKVALAWVDWQLKGNPEAAKIFLGPDSGLKKDPQWTIEIKNFDEM